MDYTYLILIAIGLSGIYLGLYYFLPYFFEQHARTLRLRSFYSAVVIALASLAVTYYTIDLTDLELANRLQHTLGGGFIAFVACFLAARDSGLVLDRMRFFIFSFLIVTALGVANEIAEFTLHYYGIFHFAEAAQDTWRDLLSNSVGALIAALLTVPLQRSSPRT